MKLLVLLVLNFVLFSCISLNSERRIASLELAPNVETLKIWIDDEGNSRTLYHESIASKAKILHLRIEDGLKDVKDIIIEAEATTRVAQKNFYTRPYIETYSSEPKNYLFKRSILNGQVFRAKITSSANWENQIIWNPLPQNNVDERRKLLNLQTHDGIPFYSLYAKPDESNVGNSKKLVILLYGGTSTYSQEVEKDHYMDDQTPNYLLERGYIVLFASFRGKKWLGNTYRKTGLGKMHTNGVKDIITALDKLGKKTEFDKENIIVIGHSRGGHMAGILSTRLSEYTDRYKIAKSIFSSGIQNPVDGYYNFFEPMTPTNRRDGESLDFVDDDWTGGALCHKPKNKFTGEEWARIVDVERKHFETELSQKYSPDQSLCQTKAYFDQSPYHHSHKVQGEVLILVGDDEEGNLNPKGAFQFQKKVGKDKVQVKVHSFGHGFYGGDSEEMNYWFNELDSFLR